ASHAVKINRNSLARSEIIPFPGEGFGGDKDFLEGQAFATGLLGAARADDFEQLVAVAVGEEFEVAAIAADIEGAWQGQIDGGFGEAGADAFEAVAGGVGGHG